MSKYSLFSNWFNCRPLSRSGLCVAESSPFPYSRESRIGRDEGDNSDGGVQYDKLSITVVISSMTKYLNQRYRLFASRVVLGCVLFGSVDCGAFSRGRVALIVDHRSGKNIVLRHDDVDRTGDGGEGEASLDESSKVNGRDALWQG